MRLIDADKIDFNEVFVGASKFAEDTRQAGKMLIDAQPTAYDVDKVLEQLEVGLANECVYERDQKVYTEAIRCAIEIVKGGGVNE
jgi:hypothetical protein